MNEIAGFLLAVLVLVLGIPIGNYLSRRTEEELKPGRKWFKRIVLLCLGGMLISLIFMDDTLLFTFAFIAIVTSRSLRKEKKGKN